MKTRYVLVIALLAGALGSVGGYLYRARSAAYAERKFHSFCYMTWDGIRQDRLDFESADPARRADAKRRFFETMAIYHNTQSIEICLDALPVRKCAYEDWGCHARHAAEIEKQLHEVTHR
jgi:hypothetical protein